MTKILLGMLLLLIICNQGLAFEGMEERIISQELNLSYESDTQVGTKDITTSYYSQRIYELESVPEVVIQKINDFEDVKYKPKIKPESFTTYDNSVSETESYVLVIIIVLLVLVLLFLSWKFVEKVVLPVWVLPSKTTQVPTTGLDIELQITEICEDLLDKGYTEEYVLGIYEQLKGELK